MEGIGINLPLLLAFLVNFIILFLLLGFLLYKPVTKMLDERQAKIKESMDQAELIRQKTSVSEQEIKSHLDTAHKEAQNVISQANQMGERLKTEAREAARKETETIIAKAQDEIQRQRDKDIQELKSQFADIAILAAEKVIKESLDKEKHRKLIDEILKDTTILK